MSPEKPSKPTKLCPTCGTRVAEDAARCLVCGSDLSTTERTAKTEKSVQGSRMPEVTLSLPAVLGLFALFLAVGAGLVWFALRQTGGAVAAIEPTTTPTVTLTVTPTASPTPMTPTPTHTPEPSPTPVSYTVKPGDTCLSIAFAFGVSVNSIVLENNLSASCDSIYPDQTLRIPQPTPTATPPATATLSPAEATEAACQKIEYTVQEGDTLSKIAANYAVPKEAISAYNGLVNDIVQFGQKLTIPLCEQLKGGPTPTATLPPPYEAPNLLLPADGASITGAGDVITLQWASVGTLRENELYAVTIEDVTQAQGNKTVEYLPDTKYIVPESLRPTDGKPHAMRWTVLTVRNVGTDDDGNAIYEPAGAVSASRVFIWQGSAATTPSP